MIEHSLKHSKDKDSGEMTAGNGIKPVLDQWRVHPSTEFQVKILGDIEKWNKYRQDNPEFIPNLSGQSLKGYNLKGANLAQADLSKADLNGTNLESANLKGANLAEVHLNDANLQSVNLIGAILTGIHVNYWLINDETDFTNCKCDFIYIDEEKIEIPQELASSYLSELKGTSKIQGDSESYQDYVKRKFQRLKVMLSNGKNADSEFRAIPSHIKIMLRGKLRG